MTDLASPLPLRGHLVLRVEEASGKTQKDEFTWDTTASNGQAFEAFVKVELRGGARNLKAQTRKQPLVGDTVTWQEDLRLDVLDGSKELRLMLCREKFSNGKKGTAVIAACGIFVDDILDAVPIDKYFELFKPNAGGEGGYIRILMNFKKDLDDLLQPTGAASPAPAQPSAQGGQSTPSGKKSGGGFKKFVKFVVVLGLAGAASASITRAVKNKRKSSKV